MPGSDVFGAQPPGSGPRSSPPTSDLAGSGGEGEAPPSPGHPPPEAVSRASGDVPGRRRRAPGAPSLDVETVLWDAGCRALVGIDEAGRGAWAGPVTVCAAHWPRGRRMPEVRDSKLLDERRREEVYGRLVRETTHGIGHASPAEIDVLGMSGALRLAGLRALGALGEAGVWSDAGILDGDWNYLAGVPGIRTVAGGDAACLSVAAASVLAKVTRDRLMAALGRDHPGFGFAANKGYPAPVHKARLAEVGPTPLHRHSWAPMREMAGLAPVVRTAGGGMPLAVAAGPQPALF